MTTSDIHTVAVGDTLPATVIESVDPARMKTLSALMRDPNPIHFDENAVVAVGLGTRTVNQGPTNVAYVVSAVAAWAGGVENIVEYRFRFLGNVFAGDRLRTGGTVTAVEETADGRIARCDLFLEVIDGARVLAGSATVHIR